MSSYWSSSWEIIQIAFWRHKMFFFFSFWLNRTIVRGFNIGIFLEKKSWRSFRQVDPVSVKWTLCLFIFGIIWTKLQNLFLFPISKKTRIITNNDFGGATRNLDTRGQQPAQVSYFSSSLPVSLTVLCVDRNSAATVLYFSSAKREKASDIRYSGRKSVDKSRAKEIIHCEK